VGFLLGLNTANKEITMTNPLPTRGMRTKKNKNKPPKRR
jgi:hypothetical protein